MSEAPPPEAQPPAQRWDLPAVEGAPLPRPGAKGVNVMHLTLPIVHKRRNPQRAICLLAFH